MADGDHRRLRVEVVASADVRAPGLARWLESVAPARARGHVTVAFVSDARIRALNRLYRKKDTATDVLSFPAEGPADAGGDDRRETRAKSGRHDHTGHPAYVESPFRRTRYLGDIVIASGVARRQARHAGHGLHTELRVLALHGLLHLLGYDHERDEGQMSRLERRLRRQGGLREGLIERASARAR